MNPMETASASTDQETGPGPLPMHHDPASARQDILAWEALHREEKHELAQYHGHVYAVGRVLLGALFLGAAAWKAARFHGTSDALAAQGYFDASLIMAAALAVEILGGAALVLGWRVRAAAWALVGYLAMVTLLVNWDVGLAINRVFVLANAGCAAALLLVAAHGAGPASLDRLWARRQRRASA